MDRMAPARWMGKHPRWCALITAVWVSLGPGSTLLDRPTVAGAVLTALSVVTGGMLGLAFSGISANATRRRARNDGPAPERTNPNAR